MSENKDIDAQRIHDLLLVSRPSEASHDASLCPFCDESGDGTDSHIDDTLGGDVTTYTQEDIDTAVAEAVAPLQAKLEALLEEQGLAEFDARLTEMSQAHEAKVAELQTEIDTAVAAAEAAKTERDEIVAFWDEVAKAEELALALSARQDEIREAVSGLFSEDYVEANLERWAGMEAEAFEIILADWTAAAEAAKTAAEASEDEASEEPAVSTAMQHGGGDGGTDVSDIRRSLYGRGNEVRNVGASYTGGVA